LGLEGDGAARPLAAYLSVVEDVALHFRGVEAEGGEKWVAADAPKGHADWNQGGTYRSASASALEYDADHNFKVNSWSYDWPASPSRSTTGGRRRAWCSS
jgi:hypothetical protein